MNKNEFESVDDYLTQLPTIRKEALEAVRDMVLKNLPEGYEECIQYGMISYIIPKEVYPETYNDQPLALLSIGNQKNHMALYMNNIYSDPKLKEWFEDAYISTGKKLDMGKSCVRFRKLENLPLEVIGEAVSRTKPDDFIKLYEQSRKARKKR